MVEAQKPKPSKYLQAHTKASITFPGLLIDIGSVTRSEKGQNRLTYETCHCFKRPRNPYIGSLMKLTQGIPHPSVPNVDTSFKKNHQALTFSLSPSMVGHPSLSTILLLRSSAVGQFG
eukprot:1608660-Amphidinium_carterae.1